MGQAARVHSSRQAGGHARQASHDAQSGGCWRGRSCAQATGQGWTWEGAECSSALRKDERWWERAGWESRETRAQGGKKTTEARVPAGGRPPTIPFLHVSVHFPRSNGHSPGRSLPSRASPHAARRRQLSHVLSPHLRHEWPCPALGDANPRRGKKVARWRPSLVDHQKKNNEGILS